MGKTGSGRPSWMSRLWGWTGVATLLWWMLASGLHLPRAILVITLSLAAFSVGSIFGFLLTSYDEERNTLGKIKDTLTGIITALTITNLQHLKDLITMFAPGGGPNDSALAFGTAATYFTLGFFFMFLQRELILNIALAQSRVERGRIEGSQATAQVIQRFLLRLPPAVVTGASDIDDVIDENDDESKKLREMLYAGDVETFLSQAEQAASTGAVDWDLASKAAYIYYYRTYFEKDASDTTTKATEWVLRALNMNPRHMDLTMKYAAMLGNKVGYDAAAAVLERLVPLPEAPMLVKQWLGFYLRDSELRFEDAIRYSEEYHQQFPEETDTFFNIAYAYATKYCRVHRFSEDNTPLELRAKALSNLKNGLLGESTMVRTVRDDWTKRDNAFECFANDPEFQELLRKFERPEDASYEKVQK